MHSRTLRKIENAICMTLIFWRRAGGLHGLFGRRELGPGSDG